MRKFWMIAAAAMFGCALVGILLGAYLHEVRMKSGGLVTGIVPSTTVSTSVTVITVTVTPDTGQPRGHPVVGQADVAVPRLTPATRQTPTMTPTADPPSAMIGPPCRPGLGKAPTNCIPFPIR